jgi:hypothetical protein
LGEPVRSNGTRFDKRDVQGALAAEVMVDGAGRYISLLADSAWLFPLLLSFYASEPQLHNFNYVYFTL